MVESKRPTFGLQNDCLVAKMYLPSVKNADEVVAEVGRDVLQVRFETCTSESLVHSSSTWTPLFEQVAGQYHP
jgi:hypothetical protein